MHQEVRAQTMWDRLGVCFTLEYSESNCIVAVNCCLWVIHPGGNSKSQLLYLDVQSTDNYPLMIEV